MAETKQKERTPGTFTVLDPKVRRVIERLAAREDRSVSKMVAILVEEALTRRGESASQ